MTQYANTFEGGTNGTTISAANSGGGSGDAFDSVTVGATGTLAFDNTHAAHGSLAAKVQAGGTSAVTYAEKVNPAAGATIAVRFYLYLTANPGSSSTFLAVLNTGGTARSKVRINTTGKLLVWNAGGSSVITQTGSIPLNQWFRVELQWTLSATVGQVTLARYDTLDSATPSETATSAATQNFGGSGDRVRYGIVDTAASLGPFWLDDLAQNDTGTAIGPASSSAVDLTLTDTPGSLRAAGGTQTLTLGLTVTDTPSAARGHGSTDTLALGVTYTDIPTAGRAGTPPSTLTLGLTLSDTAGNARTAGTRETLLLGVTFTDTPGAVRGHDGAQTLTLDLILTDLAGAARAAGTVDTLALDVPNVRGYSRSTLATAGSSSTGLTSVGSSRTTLATVGSSTAGVE